LVEIGLWFVAAASAFWATLWILGYNGFGRVAYGTIPSWLEPISMFGSHVQWTAVPSVPVTVDRSVVDSILKGYSQVSDMPDANGVPPAHYGELLPGASRLAVWDPTTTQRVAFVGLHVATYLAVIFIAITLARLVADSRGESPFAARNVARLRRIGLLVLVGAPLASFVNWLVIRWMVESSSMGDEVGVYGYRLSSVPIWTILVGAAVLVLADVWRRGVRMADDVEGLV
jgi:hypothetical protein